MESKVTVTIKFENVIVKQKSNSLWAIIENSYDESLEQWEGYDSQGNKIKLPALAKKWHNADIDSQIAMIKILSENGIVAQSITPKKSERKSKNSFIVWEGESQLNGKPITLIISGLESTGNRKTGTMIQSWIINSSINPVDATKTGEDASICGNCWRKPSLGDKCYVTVFQAPNQIYKTYVSGKYDNFEKAKKDDIDSGLRLGSYGDPVAVPLEVWNKLMENFPYHTGYTSQWRTIQSIPYRGKIQASCASMQDKHKAESLGWKTYTSLPIGHPYPDPSENMIQCPATIPQNNGKVSCSDCKLCDGKTAHVFCYDHGIDHKIRQY